MTVAGVLKAGQGVPHSGVPNRFAAMQRAVSLQVWLTAAEAALKLPSLPFTLEQGLWLLHQFFKCLQ